MMTSKRTPDPRRIVKDTVIQHDAFNRMLVRLEKLWRDALSRIPVVAPFVGETGTGKTTAIEAFERQHPRTRTPDGLNIPVLSVRTPSKPTPRALAERLLEQLGDPRPTVGSASAKLDRIITNLEKSKVGVIVLDDMQHFVDKRQNVAIFDASDFLKELVTSYDVVLVCVGLPDLERVIDSNEQLRTRSKAVFELERFDWMDPASQDQFVGVLAEFQKAIEELELPNLASPAMSLRMYLATGGLIRNVAKILGTAVGNALDAGVTKIRLQDLNAAWAEEIVGANKDYSNPFGPKFPPPDLADKIAQAKTLGERTNRPHSRRHRKSGSALAEIGL